MCDSALGEWHTENRFTGPESASTACVKLTDWVEKQGRQYDRVDNTGYRHRPADTAVFKQDRTGHCFILTCQNKKE